MSVQQSINQSILAAGALYSQSDAAEQRKGKLELQKEVKQIKKARNEFTNPEALNEYLEIKAQRLKDLGAKYGDAKAFRVGRDFTPEGKNAKAKKAAEAQEAFENSPPADYDPEIEDELASRSERQAVDEYEMAARKEKDRREKIRLMKQANHAAVQKRMEMLSDIDFRGMIGGN